MGLDKALMMVGGLPNSIRLAGELNDAVGGPLVEVGKGFSGLPAVMEEPAGAGPLVAFAAGARYLHSVGHAGPVLLLACDLPFVDAGVLRALAGYPSEQSVVPVADGYPQPLCARWSAEDLELVHRLVARGERSMKALLAASALELLEEGRLAELAELEMRAAGKEISAPAPRLPAGPAGAGHLLADVDTPEDLLRFGLASGPGC